MPDVTVRPLASDDRVAWGGLWEKYLAFYDTSRRAEIFDLTFARNMDPARPQQGCLVAQRGTDLVGLVHYIFHAHNWSAEDVCYLQDLYVDTAARGGGIGRRLIEAVYAAADTAGCPNVYWMTQEFNYAGRMLYDQVGTKTPFIKYSR